MKPASSRSSASVRPGPSGESNDTESVLSHQVLTDLGAEIHTDDPRRW